MHQHLAQCSLDLPLAGAVETSDEVAGIFKTSTARADVLITRIAGLHSYEVPCIVTWPIDKVIANYTGWIEGSVG